MSEKLKPCPFCGQLPIIFPVLEDWGFDGYVITCVNPVCKSSTHLIKETKEEAVEYWNRRVEEDKENPCSRW